MGKGWVILDKNHGRGTKITILSEVISPMLSPIKQEKLIRHVLKASRLKLLSLVGRSLSAFCRYRIKTRIETHFSSITLLRRDDRSRLNQVDVFTVNTER